MKKCILHFLISAAFIILGIILYPKIDIPNDTNGKIIEGISDESLLSITSRHPNDRSAEIGEIIATIRCNEIGLYTVVTYGATQKDVDNNDVCLTEGNQFDNPYAIVNGHAYKSFSKLNQLKPGNFIEIHAYYGDFNYKVTEVIYGYTDGTNIYDKYGNPQIDTTPEQDILYMYTCYSYNINDRLLIKAVKI